MNAHRMTMVAGILLAAGCAHLDSDKGLTAASLPAKQAFSYHDCIKSQRLPVCVDDLAEAGGTVCSCVDKNRLSGQSHSLLGVEN